MQLRLHLSRTNTAAAAATAGLHVVFVLALWLGSRGGAPVTPPPKPIAVELVREEIPQDIAATAGRVRQQRQNVTPRETPKDPTPRKPDPTRRAPDETASMDAPAAPESPVDCRHMDDTACSPCLEDPKVCAACCRKSDMDGAGGAETMGPTSPAGTCLDPPCAPEDPCPPEALNEMTATFCPKVRAAIYARLGTVRLALPEDAELSARIQVTVTAAGTLKLAALLSSSGNTQFDGAVRDSVSSAAAVLPPARVVGCVSARGCIFPVTIGAKPGGAAMDAAP